MENENIVIEEQVTEPKTYTQEEVDQIVGKRIARREAKIRKEYDRKYGSLEEVIKAGTGKETVEEMTDTFRAFYEKKGIKIPTEPRYSDRDIEVLAKAEAEDIINGGYEEVAEEVDRLAGIGLQNMTAREKVMFKTLAEHRKSADVGKELSKMGVTEDVYSSREFKEFSSKFNANISPSEIYNIYKQTQPKKDIRPMGSMRTNEIQDNGVKDHYSRDEALRFTREDFDKNPELFKAVQKSMYKW